jgi:hypothetical protein
MQMNIRHVHAGIDNGLLIRGLDCPQSTGPELSRQVLVDVEHRCSKADSFSAVGFIFCIKYRADLKPECGRAVNEAVQCMGVESSVVIGDCVPGK